MPRPKSLKSLIDTNRFKKPTRLKWGTLFDTLGISFLNEGGRKNWGVAARPDIYREAVRGHLRIGVRLNFS